MGVLGDVSPDQRERLILDHLPQVRLIARRIQRLLPGQVSLEDLIQAGVIGLISAVDHFDSSRRIKLKTYAEYRIRGAILDSLRQMDWASVRRRRKAGRIERAIATVGQRLQRTPGEEEIAVELGLTLEEYRRWLWETRGLIRELQAIEPEPVAQSDLRSG